MLKNVKKFNSDLDKFSNDLNKRSEEIIKIENAKNEAFITEVLTYLQQNSPIGTGEYRNGWYIGRASKNVLFIDNKFKYTSNYLYLPALLKHGHMTRTGGYVQPHPHIEPAKEMITKYIEAKEKEVKW